MRGASLERRKRRVMRALWRSTSLLFISLPTPTAICYVCASCNSSLLLPTKKAASDQSKASGPWSFFSATTTKSPAFTYKESNQSSQPYYLSRSQHSTLYPDSRAYSPRPGAPVPHPSVSRSVCPSRIDVRLSYSCPATSRC
jgi:hypothetical protein